jgi:ElaB/YqjD/DUF883 family membrane-anchored ribosome-binding protein
MCGKRSHLNGSYLRRLRLPQLTSEKVEEDVKELPADFEGGLERLYAYTNGAAGYAEYDLDSRLLKLAEALDQLLERRSDLADPELASARLDRRRKPKEIRRNLRASQMLVGKAKFDVRGKIMELKKKVDEWIKSLGRAFFFPLFLRSRGSRPGLRRGDPPREKAGCRRLSRGLTVAR